MPKFIKVNTVGKDNLVTEIMQQVEYIMYIAPYKEESESLAKSIIGTLKGDIMIIETYEEMKQLISSLQS